MSGVLVVDGLVRHRLELDFGAFARFPEEAQVRDVSRFHPKRFGDAVMFEAVLERAEPLAEANYVTLHADHDDFHVSVPLGPLRGEGLVVYARDGTALRASDHGPFRFLIRNPAACSTSELDDCANVKFLSRIELVCGRGRDTRPTNESEHAALHAGEAGHQP